MTNFDFVGKRNIWFALSGVVIAIGLAGLIFNGLAFGIEFKGGTLFEVKWQPPSEKRLEKKLSEAGIGKEELKNVDRKGDKATVVIETADETKTKEAKKTIEDLGAVKIDTKKDGSKTTFKASWKVADIEEVREVLKDIDLGDSVIQFVGDENNEMVIRTKHLSINKQQKVQDLIEETGATDFSIQSVGPTWGKRLSQGTVIALILSLGVVLIFVSIRFEFKMGASATVALTHDVLIAVGLYALLGREVTTSTIAAFLTILGYSMYDTIVVFDRIRENLTGMKKVTYSSMVNKSLNQVLRRSINTSMTSIIPVTSLLILGGEVLGDFAFALFIGLVSGSYSSIFIASPFLAMWKEKEPRYKAIRQRAEKEK